MSLPKPLQDAWDAAAANPGTSIDIGRTVVCDVCNEDYTDRPDEGGMIFTSWAYCPTCARRALPEIEGLGEDRFIRARCPVGMSFAGFVREYRGPEAAAPPAGYLQIGVSADSREVIVNYPDLQADANGCGQIVFSPAQAREFARLLIQHAERCRP